MGDKESEIPGVGGRRVSEKIEGALGEEGCMGEEGAGGRKKRDVNYGGGGGGRGR